LVAHYNSLAVARLLIDSGADIEGKSNNASLAHLGKVLIAEMTPLHSAAHYNSLEVARLLIEKGANTDGIDLSWMN
jgi:ankyrin repeat protein